ncbi:MAG: methyltransferase domain-containing protein [Deltaproteobacteria bacterium]|nr:methyltransferase domain-containing protein [Deltaproteobacteria bacterium]
MNAWAGSFGAQYTDRNPQTLADLEALYRSSFGRSRTEMNQEFLANLDTSARVLEVGCNLGLQLLCLQEMGFTNLYGIELQPYAVERARQTTRGINIITGSAFDVPFKDGFFDLTFTSGVLIHIAPADLPVAFDELCRCSKRWVWGFEYFAETQTEIPYRGHTALLWKADFARLLLERHPELEMVKQSRYKYVANENTDAMYLLRKR